MVLAMTTGDALKAIKNAAKAGAVVFSIHAMDRQDGRRVTAVEAIYAPVNAISIRDQKDSTYLVTGSGLAGKRSLSLVVTVEHGVFVVTVWRNFR